MEIFAPINVLFHGCVKWGRYGKARFDALFLWLDCKLDVLVERINNRVDKMVNEGMLEEVWNFYVKIKKMGWKNYVNFLFFNSLS